MEYILTYSQGLGRVSSDEYLFDITEPPALPFAFEALYYETPTNLAFKVVDAQQTALTDEEVAACKAYCDAWLATGDYPVHAYEADSGLYRGTMLKSEALATEFSYVIDKAPDAPVSKYINGEWQRVAAIIRSDGSWELMPDMLCDACVLFFSADEWASHSKPARSTERWDFATETWKDKRTLDEAKHEADVWIRNAYTVTRTKAMGAGLSLELCTWPWQSEEARAWTADNTAITPFLTAQLAAMNDGATAQTTMAELVESVLKYDGVEWLTKCGTIHGQMYKHIKAVRAATTLAEIDAVTDALSVELEDDWPPSRKVTFSVTDSVATESTVKQTEGA